MKGFLYGGPYDTQTHNQILNEIKLGLLATGEPKHLHQNKASTVFMPINRRTHV